MKKSKIRISDLHIRITLSIILFASSSFSLYSQEFRFPKPSGPHAIGTHYFYFIDKNRPDEFTQEPDDYRWISAQVWYPAKTC